MDNSRCLLKLADAGISVKRKPVLTAVNIAVYSGDMIGIYGLNGSGKSLLAELIAGRLKLENGSIERSGGLRAAVVSSAECSRMLEEDRHNDDSEFMQGRVDPGRSVRDIFRIAVDNDLNEAAIKRYEDMFNISHIMDRGIRFLSTGEFRKMMIVSSLLAKPDILVLDDPYTGLDLQTRNSLHGMIGDIKHEVKSLIFISGRLDDLDECSRLFMLRKGGLDSFASIDNIRQAATEMIPGKIKNSEGVSIDSPADRHGEREIEELIRMESVHMSYYNDKILSDINWKVVSGEHWQLSGPNGSGKSSLLSLVNGDSPKAYGQQIFLFGRKRGSGETVWEIKQQLGCVSGVLQREHRISQNVLSVVISGFFDTIGLYDKPDPVQIEKARGWCYEFGIEEFLDKPFNTLSEGMKRAVLIIRAIVKHPKLLILDEPCQGLDDLNSEFVINIVQRIINREHTTLLYVSHDPLYRMNAIDNILELVPFPGGGYTAQVKKIQHGKN